MSNPLFNRKPPSGGMGLPGSNPRQPSYNQQQPPPNPRQYSSQPPPPQQYGAGDPYGNPPPQQRQPPPQMDPYRQSAVPPPAQAPRRSAPGMELQLTKLNDKADQDLYIFKNLVAVHPSDFPPNPDGTDLYLKISGPNLRGDFVFTARPTAKLGSQRAIALSVEQRRWASVAQTDSVFAELYDPFERGAKCYLGSMDLEIGFASQKRTSNVAYEQEALAEYFLKMFQNQLLAPSQRILMDYKGTPLLCVVTTVTLVDLSLEKQTEAETPTNGDPYARGILTNQTDISFHKDPATAMNLKGSTKRNANAILRPDFKFEDMGIGGLDDEFSVIFRRAFASRIFPPALIEQLGIMHVKGILLYGPPGTGKTLIARQIGKMLQAREPKVINGPEVLNKYVGQSEENIRKLFADAEKEYKEKGDESGLHVIIFDELDAVCKQRGSGAGGGTGVGDSVVNQLLSKLDGVDQLNNILLIGMTNRKDMIDDALLRPGRLEVQVEISLPDEKGRQQILKIHTNKMRENNKLADDVNLAELATLTKNFSGAELNGLSKSAASFAFNRHTVAGTMAGVSNDASKLKVTREDFMLALSEVTPAFGVSDEELTKSIKYDILHYSPNIKQIINTCMVYVDGLQNKATRLTNISLLFHGPSGSGKTSLASYIAKESGFPFVKIISPEALVGYRDEIAKKDHIHKIFTDATKSPLSILIIDDIEGLIEWNPVGPRMSNTILQTLRTLIRSIPPKDHRLLILGTTSRRGILEQLDFATVFNQEIPVPNLHGLGELEFVLKSQNLFQDQGSLVEAMNLVQESTNGSGEVKVGIKDILDIAESARDLEEDIKAGFFADRMQAMMNRR